MEHIPKPTTSRGCGMSGCVIGIIVLLLIGSIAAVWAAPSLFHDDLEAALCGEGHELKSYRRLTTSGDTSGHACYDKDMHQTRDLGGALVIPPILMSICATLGIVLLLIAWGVRTSNHTPTTRYRVTDQGTIRVDEPSSRPTMRADLTDQLEELQQALAKGLITQAEYEQKRRSIIEKF